MKKKKKSKKKKITFVCDVGGCNYKARIGWAVLELDVYKKSCYHHHDRHKNPDDSFNFFDEFGVTRIHTLDESIKKFKKSVKKSCKALNKALADLGKTTSKTAKKAGDFGNVIDKVMSGFNKEPLGRKFLRIEMRKKRKKKIKK